MRGLNLRRRAEEDQDESFDDDFPSMDDAPGWDEDWDDDWAGGPLDDEPGEPESVGILERIKEATWPARTRANELLSAIPLGFKVGLAVVVVLGVVLGPNTGGAISNLSSTIAGDGEAGETASQDAPATDGTPVEAPATSDGRPVGDVALDRPAGAPPLPSGDGSTVLAMARVSDVAPFDGGGYDREAFPHWTDPDGNGCDARQDVLNRDFRGHTLSGCDIIGGTLFSVWDAVEITNPSDADADHIVSLAWAHASGAAEWGVDDPRREQIANDPANLVVVSASSNRSKGALGPDRWHPSDPTAACLYANRYVRIVVAYDLTLTVAEHDALAQTISGCE